MHHAYYENGGGWCAYSDIYLAVRYLRRATGGKVQRALVIDLDVHQGNGLARDKLHFKDDDFIIMDVYNAQIYPLDSYAASGIDVRLPIGVGCEDEQYLERVHQGLNSVRRLAPPDIIIYNAGTDVYCKDPIGCV